MTLWQDHAHLCETDPEATDPIFLAQHMSPYYFVQPRVAGVRVLEVGFGAGFGTAVLADTAARVVGIDLAPGNIIRAQARYPRPNLAFQQMRGERLEFPDGAFDAVVSCQVIEHVAEAQLPQFLAEIGRVLTAQGAAYISTLNLDASRKPGQPYEKNIYHEKEFTAPELEELLRGHFASVELWGVQPSLEHRLWRRLKRWGLMRWGPPAWNPIARFYQDPGRQAYQVRRDGVRRATDVLAICRKV